MSTTPPPPCDAQVFAVVLNWNNAPATLRCLAGLGIAGLAPDRCIVVDNGSQDGSPERIASGYPEAHLIRNERNRGFAGGCNPGIRAALDLGAEFIWLVNNDAVPGPDTLASFLMHARDTPACGVVGGPIRFDQPPHAMQAFGGGWVDWRLGRTRLAKDSTFLRHPGAFISGANMFIRAEVLRRIGLLDETFFFFWEDADFSRRARLDGWEIHVLPTAEVLHEGSASVGRESPRMVRLFAAGAVRYFRKHSPFPLWSICVGSFLRTARRLVHGRVGLARQEWAGTLFGPGAS